MKFEIFNTEGTSHIFLAIKAVRKVVGERVSYYSTYQPVKVESNHVKLFEMMFENLNMLILSYFSLSD